MADKEKQSQQSQYRQLEPGEYGAQYAKGRGTCYICGINQDKSKLINVTAHEMLVLELFCKATNNTPPRGYTFFCKDRTPCDKWLAERSLSMRVSPPTAPEPVKYHPKPAVTINARSRNKYG